MTEDLFDRYHGDQELIDAHADEHFDITQDLIDLSQVPANVQAESDARITARKAEFDKAEQDSIAAEGGPDDDKMFRIYEVAKARLNGAEEAQIDFTVNP